MKSSSQRIQHPTKGPMRWILGGLVAVTLFFHTTLADPFNSPKLWILMLMGAWLLGHVVGNKELILLSKSLKQLSIILFVFLTFLFIATLLTDFKYVAFFGETQRRNGFFQYLALSIVLMATAMFTRVFNVKKLFLVTFFLGLVSFIYSLLKSTEKVLIYFNYKLSVNK
jgi:hypothetical protein